MANMNSETEKLKKRLECINSKLVLRHRKLKRHNRKKQRKSLSNSKLEKQSGFLEPPSLLETTITEAVNPTKDSLPNCPVIHDSNATANETDTCKKYGLTNNEESFFSDMTLLTRWNEAPNGTTATISYSNKLSAGKEQEESNIGIASAGITSATIDTLPCTIPGKITCRIKQNLPLILTEQSSTKPPVPNCLKDDSPIANDITETPSGITSSMINDDTVLVQVNDNSYKTCLVELPSTGKAVITAFCEDHLLIIVQEEEVSFWNFTRSKWVYAGTEPRQEISTARSQGWKSSIVDLCDENLFVCTELWETRSDEKTTLTAVTYSYNQITGSSRSWCMELKQAQEFFKNITFCILPELSAVVSCSTDAITNVTKYSLNSESQATNLTAITGVITSLHGIKGCRAVILGDSPCQIFVWEHCIGTLIKTIQCPKQEAVLQWADEDKGYLFIVVTTRKQAQLIIVNLMTGRWKPVRTFGFPDTHQLRKVSVDRGKVMAVFLEGIMCWDVKSGLLAATTQTTQTNVEAFLGQRHVIYIRVDGTVEAVCFNTAVTF